MPVGSAAIAILIRATGNSCLGIPGNLPSQKFPMGIQGNYWIHCDHFWEFRKFPIFVNFCSEFWKFAIMKTHFPFSHNSYHKLTWFETILIISLSDHFWCCLLFQWYSAVIDTWFPIEYIWKQSIGFDWNERLLMMY